MFSPANRIPGESAQKAFGAATPRLSLRPGSIGYLFQQEPSRNDLRSRGYRAAFTLAELLVTVSVLVLLVLLFTQLLNSGATVTTLGRKHMDADSQARQLFDRMAIDFTQMIRRSDIDYYLKSSTTAADCPSCGLQGPGYNDEVRFYSSVPGYFSISPAPTSTQRSPMSLVAYKVNFATSSSSYLRMERLGKGLAWNGAASGWLPVWFLPLTITQAYLTTNVSDFEVIGSSVFRFEYYYLLNNGSLSDTPWYTAASLRGMQDVAALVVDIAVIDPQSRGLLKTEDIEKLAGINGQTSPLVDYTTGSGPGSLLTTWQTALDGITDVPRPAISGIRLYERWFYLSASAQ